MRLSRVRPSHARVHAPSLTSARDDGARVARGAQFVPLVSIFRRGETRDTPRRMARLRRLPPRARSSRTAVMHILFTRRPCHRRPVDEVARTRPASRPRAFSRVTPGRAHASLARRRRPSRAPRARPRIAHTVHAFASASSSRVDVHGVVFIGHCLDVIVIIFPPNPRFRQRGRRFHRQTRRRCVPRTGW